LPLTAEVRKKPEEERERETEDEAGDDGEVEGGVLAAVDDVTGKASQAERQLAPEEKKSTDKEEEAAEKKKGAAEFAEGIHGRIVEEER
jgi:hypothetical protein